MSGEPKSAAAPAATAAPAADRSVPLPIFTTQLQPEELEAKLRDDAAELASGLRERRVIVRHFRQPRIEQFLRITVGTPEQNQALLSALNTLLAD